ncbi:MAG: hypothetical protein IPL39_14645 [Opitutaceae bacterium]|nr:hypothetical protein [Opitutaceae bacterium]
MVGEITNMTVGTFKTASATSASSARSPPPTVLRGSQAPSRHGHRCPALDVRLRGAGSAVDCRSLHPGKTRQRDDRRVAVFNRSGVSSPAFSCSLGHHLLVP